MGHYDLYGNSYPTALEAMNAEMAQCAEIDSQIAYEKISKIQQSENYLYEAIRNLEHQIELLNERIVKLETKCK